MLRATTSIRSRSRRSRTTATLQCMPQNVSSLVVYYNRDLFREGGSRASRRPAGPTRSSARRPGGSRPAGKGDEVRALRRRPGARDRAPGAVRLVGGRRLVDDPDDPTRFTLDTPRGARRPARLPRPARRAAPGADRARGRGQVARRRASSTASWRCSSARAARCRRSATIKDFDWDVAAFPRAARARPSVLHSDAYCLARGKRADARLATSSSSPPGPRASGSSPAAGASCRRCGPSRESKDFLDPSRAAALEPGLPRRDRARSGGCRWRRPGPSSRTRSTSRSRRAYYTELTVDETLARIEEETDAVLAEASLRDAGARAASSKRYGDAARARRAHARGRTRASCWRCSGRRARASRRRCASSPGSSGPTRAACSIGGRDVTGVPPAQRGVAMVFQSFALFPHLTVRENIGFGLAARRTPAAERERRVRGGGRGGSGSTGCCDRRPRAAVGRRAPARGARARARPAGRRCC